MLSHKIIFFAIKKWKFLRFKSHLSFFGIKNKSNKETNTLCHSIQNSFNSILRAPFSSLIASNPIKLTVSLICELNYGSYWNKKKCMGCIFMWKLELIHNFKCMLFQNLVFLWRNLAYELTFKLYQVLLNIFFIKLLYKSQFLYK